MSLDTGEVHNDPDVESELLVQSDSMFSRYLDRPEATEESFVTDTKGARWFRTGDCTVLNSENGNYRILGRLSQDIIKKSGYKISAVEIEGQLLMNDIVSECAVVGIPDEERGEEILAYVVLKKDSKLNPQEAQRELASFITERMSNYKIPRIWKFIDELPRNQMGKVQKMELKADQANL